MTARLRTMSSKGRGARAVLLVLAILAGALSGGLTYLRKADAASTINVGPAVAIANDGTCSLLEAFDRIDELMGGGPAANTDCPQATSWPVTLNLTASYTYTLTANPNTNWAPANQETNTAFPRLQAGHHVIVQGNGATIERAASAPNFRFFDVLGGGALDLDQLTLQRGRLTSFASNGAAIRSSGTVNITNSTLQNNANVLASGGAIWSTGSLTINNSTFRNNTALLGGGAITNQGTLTISNSTLENNSTGPTSGGGHPYQ